MDESSSNTVNIIENQILRAINHIKYISKKKPCTLKIFNYLKNNYASSYDYHSAEAKLRILTGKKHPKIKLQLLPKIQIWTFGLLIHQINSF